MCSYSFISDHYIHEWQHPYRSPPMVPMPLKHPDIIPIPEILNPPKIVPLTLEEVESVRKLLEKAKQYDIDNEEPECELEDKKKTLKELAKAWGIEVEFP